MKLASLVSTLVMAFTFAASGCSSTTDPPVDPNAIDLAPPTNGVQLQTPQFTVEAGTEVQHCYWFKLASDVDLDVVRIQVKYLTGSHHMNLFQTDEQFDDHDADCFKGVFSPMGTNGYNLIVGAQTGAMDWQLPAGVGFHLKAHRQLMLQTHYVNASTQKTATGFGRVKVNLVSEPDASKITAHMGTMFANNVNVDIPPRESRSFTTSCALAKESTVVALTGHFHSRGKAFSVNLAPDGVDPTDEIYRSRAWDEPPFNVLTKAVVIPAKGALQYTCDYQNDSDAEVKFGPHVETDEHCNLFAYYYPADETGTHYCF